MQEKRWNLGYVKTVQERARGGRKIVWQDTQRSHIKKKKKKAEKLLGGSWIQEQGKIKKHKIHIKDGIFVSVSVLPM